MGNFIISEDHYDTLLGYHQSDKDIKLYFGDEFELNNKFLQKVKIFNGTIPKLKKPKIKTLSTETDVSDMIRRLKDKSTDDSITEYDFENAVKLYESMNLNRVQACDHRLWAYLCHGPFFRYIKVRTHPQKGFKDYELEEFYNYPAEIQKTIRNYIETRFFTALDNRTLRRNAVAFLWWAVELTHSPWDRWDNIEKRSDDKYHYTNIVLKEPDIYQQTIERTIGKEPRILFPLLDEIDENNLNRSQYRELIKKINSDVHIYHYSTLSYKNIREKMDAFL
jgi:hypothetical protein|tara:strand:+ start:2001 stop:2837 length:837 start_codon:yes stop_codon:yes gene_type:complete